MNITIWMTVGENFISFTYFVLNIVQQYDLHVIWGPACLVWCWTSKGWANGKMVIYGRMKHLTIIICDMYLEQYNVNIKNHFIMFFFCAWKGVLIVSNPLNGCTPIDPPPPLSPIFDLNMTKSIVLIRRYDCNFDLKVSNSCFSLLSCEHAAGSQWSNCF